MEKFNLATATDSYKASHFLQFPPNMKQAEYYLSARVPDMKARLFGLQAIIKKYFMSVPTMAQIDEAAELWEAHGEPFHYEGWKEINELGFLPLRIKSLPEGLVVPGDIPLVTTTNTTDTSGWLPGWIETLLMQVWYPTTVCTKSYD
ncbi:MAG: DUF5598 domain-containing protein, partial [Candidatus Peribacteraceae bacterium]|nr:DUF5598 domain-containing protein [Candidatus Peribacteraceae bacterium]